MPISGSMCERPARPLAALGGVLALALLIAAPGVAQEAGQPPTTMAPPNAQPSPARPGTPPGPPHVNPPNITGQPPVTPPPAAPTPGANAPTTGGVTTPSPSVITIPQEPASGQQSTPRNPEPAPTPPPPPSHKLVTTVADANLPPTALPVANGAIQLSIDDALAVAMQRNLGLLVQRFGREQFRLLIAEQLGIYDLQLTGQAYATSQTSSATSSLTGATVLNRKQRDGNFTLNQLTPWGGTGTTTFNLFRQEDNSTFSNPNPFYLANVDFTFTQPLLRNFGRVPTDRGIRAAEINSKISRETFVLQVTTTLQSVENAYWNLVEAIKQYGVAQEAVGLARELHQMNQVRVQVGTLAPLELVQSEVGIATSQEVVILQQAAVQNAEDALRQLLHVEDGPLWSMPINPTTAPETPPIPIDLDQAIATALHERPELHSQHLQLDLASNDVAYFRNQLLPQLNLLTRYGYNGTGGDVRDQQGHVIAPGGYNDAIRQVRDRSFAGWRIELDLAMPLQNRTARAQKAVADLILESGKTSLAALEESVRTQVRTAARAARTAAQEIESAGASRVLAERNLDAERKRYENGLSTSFTVLQIQQNLTSARSFEVSAIASYRRALAAYYQAIGELAQAEGVELVDPLAGDPSGRFGWSIGEPPPAAAPMGAKAR